MCNSNWNPLKKAEWQSQLTFCCKSIELSQKPTLDGLDNWNGIQSISNFVYVSQVKLAVASN